MKKYYIRYALEFLVITLGVTLSFFMEYRREKQYKEQLKEQSLSRIYENISSNDIPDFELNIRIHEMSIRNLCTEYVIKQNGFEYLKVIK